MDSESADNQKSNDGHKDILAPAEGPREDLINTAVKFLQNPKVMSSPLYQKKAFLEKKGLTHEEIESAVKRAGVVETATQQSAPAPAAQGSGTQVQVYRPGVGPPPPPGPGALQPAYAPIPPQSGWARARDLTMTTVVVASVSYAVYQVFQSYIRPWLIGKSAQERRLERLEEEVKAIHNSVQDSLSQISQTMAAIQASLTEQRQQTFSTQGDIKGIADLKADITSLKGLMLNKNQFPPLPSAAPILPSWQRAPAVTGTASSSNSTTPVSLAAAASTTAVAGASAPTSSAETSSSAGDELSQAKTTGKEQEEERTDLVTSADDTEKNFVGADAAEVESQSPVVSTES